MKYGVSTPKFPAEMTHRMHNITERVAGYLRSIYTYGIQKVAKDLFVITKVAPIGRISSYIFRHSWALGIQHQISCVLIYDSCHFVCRLYAVPLTSSSSVYWQSSSLTIKSFSRLNSSTNLFILFVHLLIDWFVFSIQNSSIDWFFPYKTVQEFQITFSKTNIYFLYSKHNKITVIFSS